MVVLVSPLSNQKGVTMRKRIQAAWLTLLMGSAVSAVSGGAVRAADVPPPYGPATGAAALTALPPSMPPSMPQLAGAVAQGSIVTTGPVYAYGPIVQRSKPRQRVQRPNWSGRNIGRYDRTGTPPPYGAYQAQARAQPWQYARPRYDGNRPGYVPWRGSPAAYAGPYGGTRGQWAGAQGPNAMAWYDRGGLQTEAPYRVRQPDWRY
jgi:hypothetical protein